MLDGHKKYMQFAILEAQKAFQKDEVPVGAVVVKNGRVIGRGYNLIETLQDSTAHAEMQAIKAAAKTLASWRLDDATLYVTLEPCPMCTGAILFSRLSTVVFGASDPRYGACGSVLQLADSESLDVHVNIISGVCQKECSNLLKTFFKKIRNRSKK